MDEELMHGATIQITYKIKVTNIGETDYSDTNFYYLGQENNADENIVTTTANQVIDYVANNLQFDSNNQVNQDAGWKFISKDDLKVQGLVNNKLFDNGSVDQFTNIITTQAFEKELKPDDDTGEVTLVLSQLITSGNTSDDLVYDNMVEIVKTSNTVGRRMAYSVVGNQDPTADAPAEVDASMAEEVSVVPPTGEVHIYYILGAVVGLILIGGITLIIRKVLKK